jgi:hypothetical protein
MTQAVSGMEVWELLDLSGYGIEKSMPLGLSEELFWVWYFTGNFLRFMAGNGQKVGQGHDYPEFSFWILDSVVSKT